MTKLLIMRHGQSKANLDGRFVGHTDSELSDLGKKQAEISAEYIVSNYKVDKVYASDLKRAFFTGKAVADKAGVEIVPEKGLREIMGGAWEGVRFDDLKENYGEPYHLWITDIGKSACPGGESIIDVMERVVKTVKKIAKENDGKTVVLASHATPVRAMQCYFENKTLDDMKNIPWVTNASVTTVNYSDGKFELIEVGHDEHLGDIITALPKNV